MCKNLGPSSVLYASQITQLDGIRFTSATIKQSSSSCRTHPPNNHVWNLRLSLAWHTREQQTQSTYKGYIIPNHPPSSSFTAHPPLFSLPGYNIRVPQQQVWVPFLNPTLFSIIKKGKGFAMVHSASCIAAWLSGAPMWPWDTEREQGWESLPNPPPSALWSAEAW